MSVKLINGKWKLDCWPDGRYGKHIRLWLPQSIATEEEAKSFEHLYLNTARRRKVGISVTDYSIRGLWPLYLDYISTNRASTTFIDVEISGRHLCKHIGEFKVTEFNGDMVEWYKKQRRQEFVPRTKRHISARTINKELSWLSGMLKWCREEKQIDVPYVKWKKLKHSRPIPIVLSKKEVTDLLFEADTFHRAAFGFMYLCGLRLSEMKGLKWADLDYSNKRVIVHGKGGKFRIVPVPEWLFEVLQHIPQIKPHIFINEDTKKPIVNVTSAMERIAIKAGITKHVNPHLLRHSFATHAVASGVNLRILQIILGHAQLETTTFYTHMAAENLDLASDQLIRTLALPVQREALPDKDMYTELNISD